MISCVRGTRDILPDEIPLWHFVEATAADLFHRYGFEEMRLPIFEVTELFARGIGDATDIVEKEMYTFADRNGQSITLRPEGTASLVRAYIQHQLYKDGGSQKYYYSGPMFRYERPQKGRYRQFYQLGAEVLGSDSPAVEAEVIDMLELLLRTLGLTETQLWINSIGDAHCRPQYLEKLQAAERDAAARLCEDCRRRIDRNPLRVLDCKNPDCQPVIDALPRISDYLCDGCREHHRRFKHYLDLHGIPYLENPRMVRGLDYYIRTTFEITSSALGAQNSLLGGGRYDGLVEQLGGPATHGFGFALGLDRFVLALPDSVRQKVAVKPDVYVAPLGESALDAGLALAARLRRAGFRVDQDFQGRSLKSHLRHADKLGARLAAILGESELAQGVVALKDLAAGQQSVAPLADIENAVRAHLTPKE
jgi:histidyl-tRNA synthetase